MRTIDRFEEEVRGKPGLWSIYGARLRHVPSREGSSASVAVWLNLMRGGSEALVDADVHETGGHLPRKLISTLKRSGYTTLGRTSTVARRVLRGSAEILAEARRAVALGNSVLLASMPPRSARPVLTHPRRLFPSGAFSELRRRAAEWHLEWLAVERRGQPTFVRTGDWNAVSWFYVFDDNEEQDPNIGVQLFRKPGRPSGTMAECNRLRAAMHDLLGPYGYRYIKLRYARGGHGPPDMINFDKEVASLAGGRRERARIDKLVFGRR